MRSFKEPGGRLERDRPLAHRRLSGTGGGDRGGCSQARDTAALHDRLRGRAGDRADAQAHQRALGDGRPGGCAPHWPCQGLLLNDFEAQALSLPTIPEGWERRIGPLKFGPEGPQVILGPGTGLGIAALVEADGRFTPVSSEACHIDFGPVRPEEFEIWPHLERAHGRITSESVISGAGLARVHRARMMAKGAPDPHVDPPGRHRERR